MSSPTLSLLQYLRITAAALHEDTRSDAELLSRYAKHHDETAFAGLVVRHGRLVASLCRQILGDKHDVEDAFQATFMALSQKAGQIRIHKTLAGWLHQVARRSAINTRTTAAARRRLEQRLQTMVRSEVSLSRETEQNETYKVMHETYKVMHDELAGLAEKLRDPLVLHYLEGKTQVEVAHILEVSEPAVRKRLERGKSILRDRLTQRGITAGTATLAIWLEATASRAAVPTSLVRRTVETVLAFRAGTLSGGTAELTRQVLQSMPYGTGWVVKTGLVALLCVSSLGAGAFVWRTASIPLRHPSTYGLLAANVKDEAAQKDDQDKISQPRLDLYGDPLPPHALQRLGTVRFRPGCNTRLLEFTPDGKGLLTAGSDLARPIGLWDKDTGKLIRKFGDFPNFCATSICAGGRVVAGWLAVRPHMTPGNPEDILYVWDVATGKLQGQFKGRSTRRQYAISPNGKFLATDLEGKFCMWNISTGKTLWEQKLREGEYVEAVAISPDSNGIASATFERDNNGNEICIMRLWETHTGKLLRTWKGDFLEKKRVHRLDFSPEGNRLIVEAYENQQSVFCLLNLSTGKVVTVGKEANGIACSPTGTIVATYKYREGIWLWEVATGRLIRYLPEFRQQGQNRLVVFSPDGKILAGTTETDGNTFWDVATGKVLRHCQNSKQTWATFAFSPDGKILAGMEGTALSCWEVATGKKLSRPRDYQGFVNSVAFTRDGKSVVSVEGNECFGVARIWNAQSSQERCAFPSGTIPRSPYILGAALSPDNKILAFGWDSLIRDPKDKDIDLWNAVSGRKLQRLEKSHKAYGFRSLVISSDHQCLICGSETQKGDTMTILWEAATGKRLPHQFPGVGLALSPDGTILFTQAIDRTGQDQHGICYLWETATGKKIGEIKVGDRDFALAFSLNGQVFSVNGGVEGLSWVTTTLNGEENEEKTKIPLYPLYRDKQLGVRIGVARTLLEINGDVSNLTFSPDGKMLAASGRRWNDSTVYLWETATGKECGRFQGHTDGVESLAFSPDGRRLASGSGDTTVLIWDITDRLDDRGNLRPTSLSAKTLEQMWMDLAGKDARLAHRAIWTLVATGQPTVAFVSKQLRPVPGAPTSKALAQLIADLDNETFAVRQKARRQLEKLGELAEPGLRQALDRQLSLESRRSVDHLLTLIEEQRARPTGETLRMLRAIEVLEKIGTAEARKLLEALSAGAAGARQTEEAKASVARLARRGVQP